MNEAISACKVLKVEGSYMWVFTVQWMKQFQPLDSKSGRFLYVGFTV